MDKPDRLRVTISFETGDASIYEWGDTDTYMDGYRELWDADISAALDPLYDATPTLVNVEPVTNSENTEQ